MKPIAVSLLNVGTEITSGEILNTNGKWLAEQLEALGFDVLLHISLPDERSLIKEALEFVDRFTPLIVVTGGLGPTSDDFTREVVAGWLKAKLEFNEATWKELEALYLKKNLRLREAHRQQCYFPTGSKLLRNPVGTAHGFYFSKPPRHVLVLPGPPREVYGMWEASVVEVLKALQPKSATRLFRWTCVGVPESEVAEVVEEVIKGTSIKAGYRASKPNVFVKLWIPHNVNAEVYIQALNEKLKQWLDPNSSDSL